MNIVTINGSPRANGYTAKLMNEITKGAQSVKAVEVKAFTPNQMELKGCQSCMACQSSGKCVVKDDMDEVYQAIDQAQVLVLGTPIYFSEMTGQLKMVFDRFFPYMKEKVSGNKKCILVTTQTYPDATMYDDYINNLKRMIMAIGFDEVEIFKAADVANDHPEHFSQSFELGVSLIN